MLRIVFTTIYTILFLSLSGITNLSAAAVSCNDTIYPGTTYKYSDALDYFVYYGGNTYAIAKSAITGKTSSPDSYFAMSANIDIGYAFDGTDTGSLRKLFSSGIYGAAQLPAVTDSATQKFITTQYGKYLGKAGTAKSSYVNAWKDFGAGSQFTQMAGGALGFSNWSSGNTPDVSKITAPQDVTMGSDGYWVNGQDGQCLSQIVEFPGQHLDCATDLSQVTGLTPGNPGTYQMPPQVCMQDLNGDGIIEANEEATCVTTAQGQFCPVGATPCTANPCPSGGNLNGSTCTVTYTATSQTAFDKPVYEQIIRNGWGMCTDTGTLTAANPYDCAATVQGYMSSSSFAGSVPVYEFFTRNGWDICTDTGALTSDNPINSVNCYGAGTVMGYVSTSSFAGSVPIYEQYIRASLGDMCVYTGSLTVGNTSNAVNCWGAGAILGYLSPVATPAYSCNGGDTLSGTTCTHTYAATTTTICPLGSQYICMNYNGTFQCSPNQCFDPVNPPGGATVDNGTDTTLQDDARNPDGSCAGQIMIFNGKSSRCRPPGLTVGYINDCCKGNTVMNEDTGNEISSAITAVKTIYDLAQIGYYTYEMATGAMNAVEVGQSAMNASTAVMSALDAASTAIDAGADAAEAMTSAIGEYAAAMMGPQIIVGIIVMVIMKVLMGSGCDQRDIQCGEMNASKECHYVGDYCERHIFGLCVQEAKGYCCFDSIMARIIQEQGRPQLTAFGPTGNWGAPDNPNCRGFTPEEFEAIDFAKIDFSEYISVIQNGLAAKIGNAQNTIQSTIQSFINQNKKP